MNAENRLTLVTGGPGTGKTRALVEGYRALTPESQRCAVLLSATKPAARDLALWVRRLQPEHPSPRALSFGQFPRSVLRLLWGHDVPQPLDETERCILLSRLIAAGPDPMWARNAEPLAEDVAAAIGLFQRYHVGPDDFEAFAGRSTHQPGEMALLAALFRQYTDTLAAAGLHDHDSLGREVLQALDDPTALARVQESHAVLFVDEAQNLDALQVALIAGIAGAAGRVVAAVDPSQRTQAYRGACEDAVAELERALGVAAVRQPAGGEGALPAVVAGTVNRVRSAYRLPGEPGAESTVAGSVRHIVARDADDEADRIAELLREVAGPAAVLARSAKAARALRERLAVRGVPVAPPQIGADCLVRRFLTDALRLLAYESDGRHGTGQPLAVAEQRAEVNAAAVHLLFAAGADLAIRSRAVEAQRKADATSSCLLDLPPEPPLAATIRWLDTARHEAGLSRKIHSLFIAVRPHVGAGRNGDAIVGGYGTALQRLERLEMVYAACGETLTAAGALAHMDALLAAAEGTDGPAAVELLVPTSAAGRRWETVVLAGLNDGEFPQQAVPSPFFTKEAAAELSAWLSSRLPAEERVALGRFERGTAETLAEERRLFCSSMARTSRDLVLSCRLRDGADDLAPSAFFLRTLPEGMAVVPRDRANGWRCVLGYSLPEDSAGLASCADCPIANCAGTHMASGENGYAFEERTVVAPFPPTVPTGPPALARDWPLSASDIEAYCACPRAFFLERILEVADSEGDNLLRGNLLHKALAAFHRLPPKDRTADALRACLAAALRDARHGFATEAAYRFQEQRVQAAVDLLVAQPDWAWDHEVLQTERSMRFDLTDGSGNRHPFVGRVDLVRKAADGRLEVVDFKASEPQTNTVWRKRMPCTADDGPLPNGKDVSVQLPLYAIGLQRQGDPVPVDAVVLECVHHKGCRAVTLALGEGGDLSPADLGTLERLVADLAAAMKGGTFLDALRDGTCGGWNRVCPCEVVCD